ncbi:MAG: hypothetical protein MUO97_05515 [Dehalococcoidia bacterium]|nr:hypothetical protein [Dehalococcoidia bacterium]
MIKGRKMYRLFPALMILALAIPVLAYSGCVCGREDYRSVTVEVFEDGHGEIRSGSTGNPCQGNYLYPSQLIGFEVQGAHLTFHSEEARRNYEEHKWEWYAEYIGRQAGWTDQQIRLWAEDQKDIERRQRAARGEDGGGGGDEQQSQPPEGRQVPELPPLEISPDELPSKTTELSPHGDAGGGGGGGK